MSPVDPSSRLQVAVDRLLDLESKCHEALSCGGLPHGSNHAQDQATAYADLAALQADVLAAARANGYYAQRAEERFETLLAVCAAYQELVNEYRVSRVLDGWEEAIGAAGAKVGTACEHMLRTLIRPDETKCLTGEGYPLVANRSIGRRAPVPALAPNPEAPGPDRQSRYCQGFDPDWWMPPLVAADWRSSCYPLAETREAVNQWRNWIDLQRTYFLGAFGQPERNEELKAKMLHDLGLIRQVAPHLLDDAVEPQTDRTNHSTDFRSVVWFGTSYTFTATQAACVKVLWREWENGTPEIGEDTILEHPEVEAEAKRLIDVFRDKKSPTRYHAAWGTMIVAGSTKGSYGLKSADNS